MTDRLSGIEAAAALQERLHAEVSNLDLAPNVLSSQSQGAKSASHLLRKAPALCVVQVGHDPASTSYIRQKEKTAAKWGFRFEHTKLGPEVSIREIEERLAWSQQNFDGVILQLPLDRTQKTSPEEVSHLLEQIRPERDADGLHPKNLGRVLSGESSPDQWTSPIPATALGVMRLLDHYKIALKGADVTVIGKSRLVGMPLSILLLHRGATVSVCHSQTKDLAHYTKNSKIVISAVGVPGLLTREFFSKNQIVVDVGTTVVEQKLRGDLAPEAVELLQAYSPVPGGVGPMTVAALMENCLRLCLA